ncbi:UNVERIFIED_CONTAM: hypothetical protein Scaly_2515700 [Sesamum calycinum]|uniref:Uncharacterized protein n=1 Tax=Sesamum calycinum TaxID=2727403 RepID=A0AAW2LV88_9LAMI
MIDTIAEVGPGVKGPSGYQIGEVRREVKEVIKRLESDLIVQANAMNEIRIFVDKLGEFGTPLARQAVSRSLPAIQKLHKLVYAHCNMRLRVRNLMYQRKDDDYYSPIDFNHIFHDNDILDEWTRCIQRSSKGKEKHVSSKEKGKQVTFKDKSAHVSSLRKDKHILPSSSNPNDSDDETAKDGDDDDDDDDDDNDGDGNMHKETQQSHGMTSVEGN